MSSPAAESTIPEILRGELPYLSADLPGLGGTIKEQIEDFVVEEIPAYPPEESGEFLFLWVEKRGLSAEQLTSHLARDLGIAHQDVGMAGMKDRQAITRQMVSVPAKCEPRLPQVTHEQIRILEIHRHRHKLRTGHLRGNRFSVLVRGAADDALEKAAAIDERIKSAGCPNYFGDQRFGRDAETLQLGLDLLRGRKSPGSIPRARRKFLLRLALSAVQSAIFNRALTDRLRAGTIHRVFAGDVMQVTASGGPFVVEDIEREQTRYDARETVLSGPIFGPKMKRATGEAGLAEEQLLTAYGFTAGAFEKFSNLTPGTRRPYLIWPAELQIASEPDGLRLQFTLPSGCYATVVLREFQKT